MSLSVVRCVSTWILGGLCVFGARNAWADPPLNPLPDPLYSFDLTSPAVQAGAVAGSDVLMVAFPAPAVHLAGVALGWDPLVDDIDALSSGHAPLSSDAVFAVLFSVDRATTGVTPPAFDLVTAGVPYNVVDQADRGHVPGDQFLSTAFCDRNGVVDAGSANNVLVRNNFDEGGEDFAAYPATHADTQLAGALPFDNVDATTRWSSGQWLYFSLSADSPGLATLPGLPSGANLYVVDPDLVGSGACCLGAIGCTADSTAAACAEAGGLWRGLGTTCAACSNSGRVGTCCLPVGGCAELPEFDCFQAGGLPVGPGLPCDVCSGGLPDVACCRPDGSCAVENELVCGATGGVPLPPEMACGACTDLFGDAPCCFGDGSCAVVDAQACHGAGGLSMGSGQDCSACAAGLELGACCHPAGCVLSNLFACFETGGVHLGPQSVCDGCSGGGDAGACCRVDGTCSIESDATCSAAGGLPLGPQTPCEMCGGFFPPAPCCLPNSSCDLLDASACAAAGGTWMGPAATCAVCDAPPGSEGCHAAEDCAPSERRDIQSGQASFPVDGAATAADSAATATDRPQPLDSPSHHGRGVHGSGALWSAYATFDQLGLTPSDDIDAVIVFDGGVAGVFDGNDVVLFSLAPGSPSLSTLPGASDSAAAAADVFAARPQQPTTLFAAAAQLGLGAASDNIDALDVQVLPLTITATSPATQHGIRGPILRKRVDIRRLRRNSIRNGG